MAERDALHDTADSLPSDVSKWNLQNLTSVGISYAEKGFMTPNEVLDGIPIICKVVSADCENLIECLSDWVNFRLPTNKNGTFKCEESFDEETGRMESVTSVMKRMLKMIESNLETLKSYCSQFQEAASAVVPRENAQLIYSAAYHLVLKVRELLIKKVKKETIYEQFFTDIMAEFGKMFCLTSSSGASIRRRLTVGDMSVTSLPDMRYSIMDLSNNPYSTATVVSVVDVKRLVNIDTDSPVTRGTNSTSPSSEPVFKKRKAETENDKNLNESNSTQTVSSDRGSYFNINTLDCEVLGRHGGELLAEYGKVFTHPYVIGLIVHGTKVILTCLKLDEEEFIEIQDEGKLREDKTVRIQYSVPLDIFSPEDRRTLYRAFFRLSDTCCSAHSSSQS